ncbi:MAG: SusC/RagA family TonB-linked outer membrane protein [Muribaculaceae bacterium]|nr:SusC/RagA family TonB-linked outer membrane protein [Muribaculaceae bacterium]
MKSKNIFLMSLAAGISLSAFAQEGTDSVVNSWLNQEYNIGVDLGVTRENSTASVSVITNDAVNRRSAKNVGNSLIGHGKGLITIAGTGTYYAQNPTFYVRGLQSLSGSTPLILVDGIERDITLVDPEEVLEVQIMKDAAATALYGYKGADGIINVITKRGEYNSRTIRVNYEHVFSNMTNKPQFVDGATYAKAMNEALYNEGQGQFAKYTQQEIDAFASGQYPLLYPNVNWGAETYRNHANGDRASIEFSGGGERFRYFSMVNFLYSDGFIKDAHKNDGYSTQDKYVRGNVRINLDVDLFKYTQLKSNIFTSLGEMQCPGDQANLWSMIYSTPAVAFPIRNDNGVWGGNSTWSGDNNPYAQSTNAAYTKIFDRSLFFNAEIVQDLCMVTPGLKFNVGASYDIISNIVENHSKKYNYGMNNVTEWVDGVPQYTYWEVADQATEMGSGASMTSFQRRLNAWAGFNYDRTFGDKHRVMAQLKYFYDFESPMGKNTSIYRHNVSLWGQYTFANRYSLGVILAEMGSSRLAPGTKWSFSPTVSLGAVILNNDDLAVNFLKARGSWGIQNLDRLPGDNVWNYYQQAYQTTGVSYPWSSKYDGGATWGETTVLQTPTVNPTHEKVAKYDVGIDASFLGCINLTADYFYNRHYDIFVDGSGAYSSLIGFSAPFKNQGKVDNRGVDIELDFNKNFGDWNVMAGGSFLFAKSKIVDMAEEPKAFDNLVNTGNPLSSTYGLVALGLFTSQEEIDNYYPQTFSTVRPGDIKYADLNGDHVIDANDVTKIGHNAICPEIFYTFNLGAEYKGIGLVAHFQGVGNWGCNLASQGYYWGLINNSSLAQEVYDNRWNAESNNSADALYPRLSSSTNANNYRTSTFWQRDRSYLKLRNIELYYNFDKNLLAKTGFITDARVFVRGVDLCNIATGGDDKLTGLDPEATGISAPLSRQIAVGVKLTF